MPIPLDKDFKDMLSAFTDAGVKYLLVGSHAMAVHGAPRYTQDIDLWVDGETENARRTYRALAAFGAPMNLYSESDFHTSDMIIQIGVAPNRIDIMTEISGVRFDEAWTKRIELDVEGIRVPVIGREHLLVNKRATGREKDLLDVRHLERPAE